MDEIELQILLNQKSILNALSKIMLSKNVFYKELTANINDLTDRYHETKRLLGEDYIDRPNMRGK